jgi:hypothetical protein
MLRRSTLTTRRLLPSTDGAVVDASKFVGATAINQAGFAAAVTNLAAGTVAGFKGTASSAGIAALSVTAAAAAAAAAVNLDGAKGIDGGAAGSFDPGDNTVGLAVAGAALNSVTVTGTLAQAVTSTIAAEAANLDLVVSGSTTATSFTLNTAVNTTLTLDAAMTAVTSVDTSAGSGGVTFNGGTQVQTITTGAGKDTITAAFATTASKGATIATGDGNDTINVNTTGAGLTSVDAGAGNDTINVAKAAGNKLNIQAGDGDDTVVLTGAALTTTDVIDGGAGVDVISLAGSLAARTDDDFIVLNSLLKNFETLKLSSAEGTTLATGLNVAKLGANYTTIDFATDSFADNVGTQMLIANGNLTAEAAGFKAEVAGPPVVPAVYAGSLNITSKADGLVKATAETVTLTVDASKADVAAALEGFAKTATVNLVTATDNKGTTATADDDLFSAAFTLINHTANANKDLTSLTITGNGTATVVNAVDTKLVTVDASGLNSVDIAGKAAAGLTYVSANALAETIKLGGGIDSVTLSASTYGAVNAKTFDTVEGLNLVLNDAKTALAATSDLLVVTGFGDLTANGKMVTTQTDFDLALKDAASYKVGGVDVDTVAFLFDGNTYLYADKGTAGVVDAADIVVKLAGTIDLDALVVGLN